MDAAVSLPSRPGVSRQEASAWRANPTLEMTQNRPKGRFFIVEDIGFEASRRRDRTGSANGQDAIGR